MTGAVRAFIGREATYTAPESLGRASIRYFARAVGDANPVYTDEGAARAAGYDGVIAPPTLVVDTNQYMTGPPNADGYSGHSWELPVSGCRLVRGGHLYEFGRPVTPDDVLTAHWRIVDIHEKTSRSGREMLVVTNQVELSDARAEFLGRNTETLIYQEASSPLPSAGGARGAPDLPAGDALPDLERSLELPNLVAYAGATWDWHRYHYDRDAAAATGLRAPVVDGQMLGALLAEHAQDGLEPGARAVAIAFRISGMVFAGDRVLVRGAIAANQRDEVTVVQDLRVGVRVCVAGATTRVALSRSSRKTRSELPRTPLL
jgi:acyl dehydratase